MTTKKQNEIFEECDSNQTASNSDFKTFEECDSNQTKKGRGGARKNSGKKPSGIKTSTIRIDARIYPLVLTLKWELQDGNLSRDDIRELMKRADKTFIDSKSSELQARINRLESENLLLRKALQSTKDAMPTYSSGSGLNAKLRKRLIQFCHPDKHQDEKTKAIANELTQLLNELSK